MRWIFLTLVLANLAYFGVAYLSVGDAEFVEPSNQESSDIDLGESLVLLSELQESELQAMLAAKDRLRMTESEDQDGQSLCTLVGPFKEFLPAEYFSERLLSLDIAASVEQVEVPGQEGFWVYQEAQLSRKAALRRLYEFQAKGVDSYIIPRGELENGISFGIYPTRDEAELRQLEIAELGFTAEIKAAERSFEEIWLVLQPEEAAKADEELWLELLNPEDGVELLQNFCPAAE
ncbi:MAG: hypothetical protein AseanaTS_31050 [Candidatus Pelagadaptatus aseana]|uniref:hypothetical protein n=1 Tax=Candidatus Pelagadaptatus aseana TaxID=3120508 RepID=UPI0039B1DD7B